MKKTIIVDNGSTSKKYALYDNLTQSLFSHYEKIPETFLLTEVKSGDEKESKISPETFDNSFADFIDRLFKYDLIGTEDDIGTIAIRIVAPGKFFQDHRLINKDYLMKLDEVCELSPLHIKPVKAELANIKDRLGEVKIVSISDSAFHKTITEPAKMYAFPFELTEKLELYRYGYHGISVSSVLREFSNNFGEAANIIVCHLGGGSSVTAIKNGRSFDTSMGFSPLEGLPMATRIGNADINAVISVMDSENFDSTELQTFLYKECGMKGLSGVSDDTRVILEAAQKGNKNAELALNVYAYQIKKTIGAYRTVLGSLDALIFTGTIGERSAEIRRRICDGLESIGISIDLAKNKVQLSGRGLIGTPSSPIKIAVLPTSEIEEMAKISATIINN